MVIVELFGLDESAENPLVSRVLQRLGDVGRVAEGYDGNPEGVGQRLDPHRPDRATAPLVLPVQLVL